MGQTLCVQNSGSGFPELPETTIKQRQRSEGSSQGSSEHWALTDEAARDIGLQSVSRPSRGGSPTVCCLVWALSQQELDKAQEDRIAAFHKELTSCVTFFGGEMLEYQATSGHILGRPLDSANMTAADCCVRLGQCLCRWSVNMQPHFGLYIGVDVGTVQALDLPGQGRCSYFGTACAGARRLAFCGGPARVVHLSGAVKDQLGALKMMRLTVYSPLASYYLEPSTKSNSQDSPGYEEDRRSTPRGSGQYSRESDIVLDLPRESTIQTMSLQEFTELLERHGIDTKKFGKGQAKPLKEFYETVVRDEKSFITVRDNILEHVIELVRISLRTRDRQNKQLELRIQSKQSDDGSNMHIRSQPLTLMLKQSDKGHWQEAVEKCFEKKFNISAKTQKVCFSVDRNAYTYSEDRAQSDTIPGITSTYKTHSIIVTVREKNRKELEGIGLPDCKDFSTDGSSGTHNTWTWSQVVADPRETELMHLLQTSGIDASSFSWKAFADLFDEVYEKGQFRLEVQDNSLVRTICIIKVLLHADILNVDHVLVIKSKRQNGKTSTDQYGRSITMRMDVDQDWEDAVEEALALRVGIDAQDQRELLVVESGSHTTREEVGYSQSYPGLKTLYVVNEASVRVASPQDRRWQSIGLPGGNDFIFVRKDDALPSSGKQDVIVTQWGWLTASDFGLDGATARAETVPTYFDSDREGQLQSVSEFEEEVMALRRVVPPSALLVKGEDELLLNKLMLGKQTDWVRGRRAAESVWNPNYTTKDFYDDVTAAFPELRLYCINRESEVGACPSVRSMPSTASVMTSARTSDDEYQRTIGALFAVFWLMRVHIDGKECFCYGLSSSWRPKTKADFDVDNSPEAAAEYAKRSNFLEKTDWLTLQRLCVGAGLMQDHDLQSDGSGESKPDTERMLALIVLMVIHDIMKLDVLQPSVGMSLDEFCGYKRGEVIMDHDVALSYVLEHCPTALPSFAGLSNRQQDSIRFTHCKLEYNMGWLVQAEAPPGQLFRAFRRVVIEGKARSEDIAFYFVHWFADLAGAEPCPLAGCEKFVLKFPLHVLGNFVDSFQVVWTLGPDKTETQVFEDYLVWRWRKHEPSLGEPPTGKGSIAQMRLVLMAQGASDQVIKQFNLLPEDDRQVLSEELAMTGCSDQRFVMDELKDYCALRGPAILVYYGPALMQKSGKKDPRGALLTLAEVFRQARELYPLSLERVQRNRSVIVRIDAIKDLETHRIWGPQPGHHYVLCKNSEQDAYIKLLPVTDFRKLDWNTHQILEFGEHRAKRQNVLGSAYRRVRNILSLGTTATGSKHAGEFSQFSV